MLNMNRFTLIACLLALMTSIPTSAQRRNKNKSAEPQMTPQELIMNYRFEEASRALQRELNKAERKGESTDQIEADIRRANLGADMLRGTEKINFVDSFKVSYTQVAEVMKLSAGVGKLTALTPHLDKMKTHPAVVGKTAYVNELGDRIFFSASQKEDMPKHIWSAYRSGKGWGVPAPLNGMQDEADDEDNPFVMPDGVTMYFAAKGENSVGGYDLFVTRYDADSKKYLKAENLGMPLNSPANDYFLAIDELSNLGWLVTDRNQPEGIVCVYVFVPTESREIYEQTEENASKVVKIASLHSIAESQYDVKAVADARLRLKAVMEQVKQNRAKHRMYVINDQRVYTSLDDFRSDAARRIAMEVDKTKDKIDEMLELKDDLLRQVASGERSKENLEKLKQINLNLPSLQAQYRTLCKNMRLAEVK